MTKHRSITLADLEGAESRWARAPLELRAILESGVVSQVPYAPTNPAEIADLSKEAGRPLTETEALKSAASRYCFNCFLGQCTSHTKEERS